MPISRAGISSRNRVDAKTIAHAFTLLELVVVLVVLGVSAAVVFPKLDVFLVSEAEPWRSARRLARTGRYAHELAVATESVFLLQVDPSAGTYRVIAPAANEDSREAMGHLELRGRLPPEVEIRRVEFLGESWVSEDPLKIRFSPDGWCDSTTISMAGSDGTVAGIVIGEWFGEIEVIGEDWMP